MKVQAFCQDHWDPIVEEMEERRINGIALQPLAFEGLLAHEDGLEEFDHIIGEYPDDANRVMEEAAPVCCWLEGRERYAEGTDFEDDYQIFLAVGRIPSPNSDQEEEPESWWVDKED